MRESKRIQGLASFCFKRESPVFLQCLQAEADADTLDAVTGCWKECLSRSRGVTRLSSLLLHSVDREVSCVGAMGRVASLSRVVAVSSCARICNLMHSQWICAGAASCSQAQRVGTVVAVFAQSTCTLIVLSLGNGGSAKARSCN